jgi:hypothetical protein
MLLAVLSLALLPAQASAASQDVAATHAYIQANYAVARARVAQIAPAQARIEGFKHQLARECPGVGAGSLQNEASQPVSYEVASALWAVAYGAGAGPARKFVSAVSRLRWSNSATTRMAQRFARNLQELTALRTPNLCADVTSWKASGFQVIPASALSLVHQVESIQPRTIPAGVLAPYVRGADAGILKRTIALELKLEENEFKVGQIDWIHTLETLGLNE